MNSLASGDSLDFGGVPLDWSELALGVRSSGVGGSCVTGSFSSGESRWDSRDFGDSPGGLGDPFSMRLEELWDFSIESGSEGSGHRGLFFSCDRVFQ